MKPRAWWIGLGLLAAACGGDGDDLPVPADLEIVSASDGQSAPAGARLPNPLAVIVRAGDGGVAPRGAVAWAVTAGEGTLSDDTTLADGTGRAEVTLTLGTAQGAVTVRATLANAPSVSVQFTATATSPPVLSQVDPATFTGGDTVTVSGSLLTEGVVIEFDDTPARLLAVDPSGTLVTAVVPLCLVPGELGIRARIDLAVSNTVLGTYEASGAAVQLGVGDYASIRPTNLGQCATFPGATVAGAEYLFAPQSVTGVTGQTAPFRLRGDEVTMIVTPPPAPRREATVADRFHRFLRDREEELARVPKPPREPELAPLAAAAPVIGDRRTFRVCRVVTCSAVDDFARVTAEVKFAGDHAIIYQDLEAPANGLTDQDFATVGQTFDRDLYEVDARAFGAESDVDRNGRVVVLMTPVVNGLTPRSECETAIITGFFFALDIDPAFRNDERSNQAEVFYALTADPNGTVSCNHSVDRIRRLVPVTFIHELQHMISYHQHVLVRRGQSEVIWLNEAMSHLAEELGALHFLELGDDASFSRFAIGNLFNAFLYLKNPGAVFALFREGTGTLEERGASWLFLRWVVDQFGDGVIRRLSESGATGAANVEQATGEPPEVLLPQWFFANYVSDLPGFAAPARLQYATWAFRTTYESLHQQAPNDFDRPFPLVPDSARGGAFELNGSLRSGSGYYFRVIQDALQRGFTLQFTDPDGGSVDPNVAPRLNVIRVR